MTALDATGEPGLSHAPTSARQRNFALRSETAKAYSLLSPALLTVIIGLGAPLALLVLYSFWTQDYVTIDTTPTLANYSKILTEPIYWPILLRSLLISIAVTITSVLIAYPVAYFLAFDVTRYKVVWLILITLPFWTGYLLRVFSWKLILGFNGVINSGLMSLGLIAAPLEFLLYNPFAVFLTLVYGWVTFAILPIYVSLEKIDRSLLEAATDLGDGPLERFWRITFPLSLPGVVAAALVILVPTVGDYVTPALVGGPDGQMIANVIQRQFGQANNWPLGAALSVVSMLVVTGLACAVAWFARISTGRIG